VKFALALVRSASCASDAQPISVREPECYLSVSYVQDTELSGEIWEHLLRHSTLLLDDASFGASLWYTKGDGRAGFVYRSDCRIARTELAQTLDQFANTASNPEVANALRDSKQSMRQVTEAEFADVRVSVR
jgi:hypothetical protein